MDRIRSLSRRLLVCVLIVLWGPFGAVGLASGDEPDLVAEAEPQSGEAEPNGEEQESDGNAEPQAEQEEEVPPDDISNFLPGRQSPQRSSDIGPAGVALEHTLKKRDWTFSYHYSQVEKSGLLNASSSDPDYTVMPRAEETQTHWLSVMYGSHDRLNFSLMLPYIEQWMEVDDDGTLRQVSTSGIGDAKLMFLIPFIRKGAEKSHVNVGMSFPTGSIEERDSGGNRLPYDMQLGSGTWDIVWGLTYTGSHRWMSWGSQFEGVYRLSTNDIGYRLGTVYQASIWTSASCTDYVSTSLRFSWTRDGNIHGEDPDLLLVAPDGDPVSPLNDNMHQAGTRLEIGPGVNIMLPIFGKQVFALEAVWPVYENRDGLQLATEITFTAGWQWVF